MIEEGRIPVWRDFTVEASDRGSGPGVTGEFICPGDVEAVVRAVLHEEGWRKGPEEPVQTYTMGGTDGNLTIPNPSQTWGPGTTYGTISHDGMTHVGSPVCGVPLSDPGTVGGEGPPAPPPEPDPGAEFDDTAGYWREQYLAANMERADWKCWYLQAEAELAAVQERLATKAVEGGEPGRPYVPQTEAENTAYSNGACAGYSQAAKEAQERIAALEAEVARIPELEKGLAAKEEAVREAGDRIAGLRLRHEGQRHNLLFYQSRELEDGQTIRRLTAERDVAQGELEEVRQHDIETMGRWAGLRLKLRQAEEALEALRTAAGEVVTRWDAIREDDDAEIFHGFGIPMAEAADALRALLPEEKPDPPVRVGNLGPDGLHIRVKGEEYVVAVEGLPEAETACSHEWGAAAMITTGGLIRTCVRCGAQKTEPAMPGLEPTMTERT